MDIWVNILTVLLSTAGAMAGSYMIFLYRMKRVPSQNKKDEIESESTAFDLAEKATKRVLELETKIQEYDKIFKNSHYRATIIFSLGDPPRVEQASIEAIKYPQPTQC